MPVSAPAAVRRVVTGLDAEGRSCILFDGPVARAGEGDMAGTSNIWRTAAIPASNAGIEDEGAAPFEFGQLSAPGSGFILVDYPAGMSASGAYMHATDTIDYIVMLQGEVTLVVETGEVVLRAGDVAVDRGIVHGWRNDSTAPAVAAVVHLPSIPVGAGGTL